MSEQSNDSTLEAARVLASISILPASNIESKRPPSNKQCESDHLNLDNKMASNSQTCSLNFPMILMGMIANPLHSEFLSWLPQGFAFMLKDSKKFNQEIVQNLKIGSKSIENELKRWGFQLISRGPKHNVFFHKNFHRDKPLLCERMRPLVGITNTKFCDAVEEHKKKNHASLDIDFDFSQSMQYSTATTNVSHPKKETTNNEKIFSCSNGKNRGNNASSDHETSISNISQNIPKHLKLGAHFDNEKFKEQTITILSNISRRRIANDESHNRLAKQLIPGSELAEMNKSLQSFREYHYYVISASIEALSGNESNKS